MTISRLTKRHLVFHVLLGLGVLLIIVAISPGIGSQPVGIGQAWDYMLGGVDVGESIEVAIVRDIAKLRLSRTICALLAGTTLALCGAVTQTQFRNVLATPYTLGIASGGALGAAISVLMGLDELTFGLPGASWCALLGCAAVVGLVLLLAGTMYGLSGNSLVLAGVAIGFFCSAMLMFATYLADVREKERIVRWMMGSVETTGFGEPMRMLAPMAISWIGLIACGPGLNQLQLGEELAATRGVRVGLLQVLNIGFASLGTACVVSLCGPIGFVGLLVPHTVRLIVGRDHRLLLPVAAVWGGVFLIVCDWFARLMPVWWGRWFSGEISAAALPIGVVTSAIGAPVFLLLLCKDRVNRKIG